VLAKRLVLTTIVPTVTTRALTRPHSPVGLRLCVGAKLRAAGFYKWWLVRQLPTVSSKLGRPRVK
jgi:hypothetical protein